MLFRLPFHLHGSCDDTAEETEKVHKGGPQKQPGGKPSANPPTPQRPLMQALARTCKFWRIKSDTKTCIRLASDLMQV